MKVAWSGFVIQCDKCGDHLVNDEDTRMIAQEDEIADYLNVYDWVADGDKHYCPECQIKK